MSFWFVSLKYAMLLPVIWWPSHQPA